MAPSAPIRRVLASALVVLYVAFVVLGGSLVKCQEADGTISLEWRGGNCCVPQAPDHAGSAPCAAECPQESDEDCGGCQDVSLADTLASLSVRGVSKETVKAPDAPAPPVVLLTTDLPVQFVAVSQRANQMRAPHPPPPLEALRSTVLRC